jgi:hypothetical protein
MNINNYSHDTKSRFNNRYASNRLKADRILGRSYYSIGSVDAVTRNPLCSVETADSNLVLPNQLVDSAVAGPIPPFGTFGTFSMV